MNIYCFSTLSFAKLQFKSVINKAFHKHGVASFTDAWIETLILEAPDMSIPVASFTDAWIETYFLLFDGWVAVVASFTDAWIETCLQCNNLSCLQSHLLQMRGLKHESKRVVVGMANVASFTDAWIETYRGNFVGLSISSRIFYRCVD